MVFRLTSIQAEYGDSLLVSYGSESDGLRHVLIDGGTGATLPNLLHVLDQYRTNGRLRLEALVVTHYDRDHIDGIIELLLSPPDWLDVADIWFNGRRHLVPRDLLGPAEADALSDLIDGHYSWNKGFNGRAITAEADVQTFPGGLSCLILSPDDHSLAKLGANWPVTKGVPPKAADLLGATDKWPPQHFTKYASTFSRDGSIANRSSIALVFEHAGKRMLLAGDAHPDLIINGLRTHYGSARPDFSLVKLSHHGSKGNTSLSMLQKIRCSNYLISTNGDRFKHPDFATIARVANACIEPTLIFNYAVERTLWWKNRLPGWPTIRCVFPSLGEPFVSVDL